MKQFLHLFIWISLGFLLCGIANAQNDTPHAKIKATPVFHEGEAQVVPEFNDPGYWIREGLWVETEFDSDGDGKPDRMYVDVTRQRQTETEGLKLPVIYETSPYFAGTGPVGKKYLWDVKQELNTTPPPRKHIPKFKGKVNLPILSNSHVKQWVPRGFIVVHSCSPGTGLSQGCPTVGGDNESLAPKAVIDWLNGRARGFATPDGNEEVTAYWATGKVGMIGTSYNGTLALAAATTGVDGLKAIIPVAPNTSYYHYYRSNGLIRHPGGWLGEDIDYLYDWIHSGNPGRCAYCDSVVRDKEMYGGFDRVSGDYNDFWSGRDYLEDISPLKAAVLMAHAFNDWNVMPEHSYRIIKALKEKGVPLQIYYHQEGHGGEPPMDMMNRWFSHYLFGIDNGVGNGPQAWIVREGAKRAEPSPYEGFPNPGAKPVKLYLQKGAPEIGGLTLNPATKQGKETLVDNVYFNGPALAQAGNSRHRLLFASPCLSEDVHISGETSITIRLASSKPAANLSVWLVSLPWDNRLRAKITDNIITRGWADPQNYKSLTESVPLKKKKFYEMTFKLQPDDQIIPAGQQIGLMIFSSDRDFTLWPRPGTKLTVDLDATSLMLPVVGGTAAFSRAIRL